MEIGDVQRLGPCSRLTFAVRQGDMLVAVVELIVPNENVRAIAQALLAAVADLPDDPIAALKTFDTRNVRAS